MTERAVPVAEPRTLVASFVARAATWLGGPIGMKVLSLIVLAALWEIGGRASDGFLIAPISATLVALFALVTDVAFWAAMADSFSALALGLSAAIIFGVVVGALIGHIRAVGLIGIPYTVFFLAVPMSALIPVVVVAAGIDVAARATVVFLFAVSEIVWNTHLGVRSADRALVEMAHSFGGTRRKLFTRVLVPSAVPALMAGIRLGTGRAFIGMVSAELLLASVGVGLLIKRFQSRFQAPELFATILFLLIAAALVQFVVQAVERRMLARFAPH